MISCVCLAQLTTCVSLSSGYFSLKLLYMRELSKCVKLLWNLRLTEDLTRKSDVKCFKSTQKRNESG